MNSRNYGGLVKNADSKIMNWLVDMHGTLSKDKIDIKAVDNLLEILKRYMEDSKNDYINTILYPETVMYKKIPTLFPIPTSSFQTHFYYSNITTNSNGNFAWTWNPFFLSDAGSVERTTFFVNSSTSLTGSAPDTNFTAGMLNYNQIPTGIYGSYRVVSASVICSYVGRMDTVSGVLGIGVGLNNSGVGIPALATTTDPQSSTFGNFAQIDNLFFHEKTQTANGVRAIYFPIDDKCTYFYPILTSNGPGATLANTYNTGFYFAGYGQGLQSSVAGLVRFDFYVNYECIVQPGYNNFIPSTPGNSSGVNAIQTASELIQKTPELIVKGGSEIPGTNQDIGGGSLMKKLFRTDEDTMLPNISILSRTYR